MKDQYTWKSEGTGSVEHPETARRDVNANDTNGVLVELMEKVTQQLTVVESLTTSVSKIPIALEQLTILLSELQSSHKSLSSTVDGKEEYYEKRSIDKKETKEDIKNYKSKGMKCKKNKDGYCEGDTVKIVFDRGGNYFNRKDRRTATINEGKCGIVVGVSPCFVTILLKGEKVGIKKANENVQLVTSVEG
jgi:hypothetical protein